MGNLEIVKLLLANGADVAAQGGKYGTALQAALSLPSIVSYSSKKYKDHAAIAHLLLDKEADINSHGGLFGNPLQSASIGGFVELARLL